MTWTARELAAISARDPNLNTGSSPPKTDSRTRAQAQKDTHTCMHTEDLCPATAGTSGKEEGLGETAGRGEEPVGASKAELPFENSGSRDTGSCRVSGPEEVGGGQPQSPGVGRVSEDQGQQRRGPGTPAIRSSFQRPQAVGGACRGFRQQGDLRKLWQWGGQRT